MITLARKLRLVDYFTLAFGTMIGVGWLVLMDDWLGRGGPAGAILGFLLGAVVLLPVGYVYGQWVLRLPDAAGEAAYVAQVFPPVVSFLTGWMMLLAYFIVCPWEAVAFGKIAAYIFPALDSMPLYHIAGHAVFLPRLVLGMGLTGFLTFLNYRGIRFSANFQNWSTGMVLFLFLFVLGISARHGTAANFRPLFHAAPAVSILLTLQIVPYFMTGFESVAKSAEEAHPEFRNKSFQHAIALALLVGALFYALAIASVAYITPWQSVLGKRFATAIAFEQAVGARWPVQLILTMALFALFEVFNGNFVASSRLLFASGRRNAVSARFGEIHARYQTPGIAVLAIGAGTAAGLVLGDAILVPITEVGSAASALGWLAACVSFFVVEPRPRMRVIAGAGALASLVFALMKFVPGVPGHFTEWEWLALGLWLGLGFFLRMFASKPAQQELKQG
jgi:APA family basic amino acid/polyamine antiporter